MPRVLIIASLILALTNLYAGEAKPLDKPAAAPIAKEAPELLKIVQASESKLVVLNVWATFCLPCKKEFPHFVQLHRDYKDKGVEVMFVTADFDDAIPDCVEFLTKQGVDWPSYLKAGGDEAFINTLNPDWTGALPATFIYKNGKLVDFFEKPVDYAALETYTKKHLN